MGDIIQPLKWIVGKDGFTLLDAEGKPLATVVKTQDGHVIATCGQLSHTYDNIPHPSVLPYYLGRARLWAQSKIVALVDDTFVDYEKPEGFNPTPEERWDCGFDHDPRSEAIYSAVARFDFQHNNDRCDFCTLMRKTRANQSFQHCGGNP